MLTNKTELLKYLSRLAQVKPSLTLEDLKRRRAGEEFFDEFRGFWCKGA